MSKKNTKKHMIWSNYNLELNLDWCQSIREIRDISRYTRSLGKRIKQIYGW